MSRFTSCLRLLMLSSLLESTPALADDVAPRPEAPAPVKPKAEPSAAAPKAAPVPDAEGFVPESRPANMTTVDASIPAAPLVAVAYGFIWLMVFGFVVFTLQRTRKLEREIAELAERIKTPTKASRA